MGSFFKLLVTFVLGAALGVFGLKTFLESKGLSLQPPTFNVSVPTSETEDLREAWGEYYAAVEEVRTNFEASPSFTIDQAHRAGTYQVLQAVMAGNLNGLMGGGDGTYPHIRLVLSPSMKLGVDNPDTFYRGATVSNPDGESIYRVWGNRGTASDFLFETFYGPDPNGGIAVFEDEDLVTDAAGNFELFLSASRPEGVDNWMELARDDRRLLLLIRDSFTNWEAETAATLNIERLGEAGVPSPDLTEAALVTQIKDATQVLLRQGQFWPDFSSKLRALGDNKFAPFRSSGTLGILSQYFAPGFYSVAEGEALIVTIPNVEAGYCGLQLANFWAASPDWVNRQTSLSWCNEGAQAHQSADGSYVFVISPDDPGVQNWIDTAGNTQGLLYARIQSPGLALEDAPRPATQLVKISELANYLPADMPRFDAAARADQLRKRQEHARRRYQTW